MANINGSNEMKKIICCCDGSWNTPDQRHDGVLVPTNVVRIHNAIEEVDSEAHRQLVYYHPGVGTGRSWYDKLLGGGVGKGLSQHIMSAYRFLCEHYVPGDAIYLFGFSRGAFTVRSLAGFIYRCGLLDLHDLTDDSVIWKRISTAFDEGYRKRIDRPKWGDGWPFTDDVPIHFIGVWDTVGALGIPSGLGLLSLLDSPERYAFNDTKLNPNIKHARHAVSIDERRASFQPTLWDEDNLSADSDLKQVWFPGVHSDVGGGYPQAGLSNGALLWMIDEAQHCGLAFKPAMLEQIQSSALGDMHDSFTGLFQVLPSRPRAIPHFSDCEHSGLFSISARERHEAPPIIQAPYHHCRELKQDTPISLDVFACNPWNETGIWLEAGKTYHFSAHGEWKDRSKSCGPNGVSHMGFNWQGIVFMLLSLWGSFEKLIRRLTRNFALHLFGAKREAHYPWLSLMGCVANNMPSDDPDDPLGRHEIFLIGHELAQFSPHKSGYFYAFANDAWVFYKKNQGSIRLTISVMD